MGRGPANPSTPGEGWENVEPSQSRAQPLQEVCSRVPRTLQLSQIAEGLVGGKEPVLGSIPQAGLKRGQGRPWESIKHLTQMGVPRRLSESCLSVPMKMVISLLFVAAAALVHSSVVLTGPHAPLPCFYVCSLWMPCPFLLFSWCWLLQFLLHLWLASCPLFTPQSKLSRSPRWPVPPPRSSQSPILRLHCYAIIPYVTCIMSVAFLPYLWYYYGSTKDLELIHHY